MKLSHILHIPMIGLISAFITLDFALLFLNIHITSALEHNALMINVTGRQRMLSQRLAKNLLIQCDSIHPETVYLAQICLNDEINDAANMFNSTLDSLVKGGEILTPDGRAQTIPPLQDRLSQQILSQTSTLWSTAYTAIQHINQQPSQRLLEHLYTFALEDSEQILDLMNRLAVRSEKITQQNAATLRHTQMVIFILALLNFMLIILRFYQANKHSNIFVYHLYQLVRCLPQAILLIDRKQRIIYANKAMGTLLEQSCHHLKSQPLRTFIPPPYQNRTLTLAGKHIDLSISNIVTIPYIIKMITLVDITETEQFKLQSLCDPLTQLYNRNGLNKAYAQQTHTDRITCLFLDLNKFKQINDMYGHTTGDQVLQVIAKRLRQSLKQKDIVARFGGDEFVVIINAALSEQEIASLSTRIKKVVSKEIQIKKTTLSIGLSVGAYVGDASQEPLETIIHHADVAMYSDKRGQ